MATSLGLINQHLLRRFSHAPLPELLVQGTEGVLCNSDRVLVNGTCLGTLTTLEANFRNWDLAVDGSPSKSTLMSPLRNVPSGSFCNRNNQFCCTLPTAHGCTVGCTLNQNNRSAYPAEISAMDRYSFISARARPQSINLSCQTWLNK